MSKNSNSTHIIALQVNEWTLTQILQDTNIESIEEDRILRPTLTDTPGLVNAVTAWNLGYDGTGQTVVIVDTGVDTAHPFLSGKTVAEACFSNAPVGYTGLCPNGQDSQIGPGAGIHCANYNAGCYHGTHVAGIAVGKRGVLGTNAGGIAPGASLIPIQVFVEDCSAGCTLGAFTSDLILALDHVYSLRNTYSIASVNMSLGGSPMTAPCDTASPSLTSSINSLRSANIATVIASGNNSDATQISFPACISSAISVGSTTKQNVVSSFSNGGTALKLLAPGSDIYSSMSGGGYSALNGTSMATPHVAGGWATVRNARPLAQVSDVLNAFTLTGTPILDARNGLTQPLIQVNAAINALAGNVAPTISITAPVNGATYSSPANITLNATATDSDGTITKVEFYNGTTLLNTDTTSPYSFNWTNVGAGSYTLTAKATDNANATTTSTAISVTVTGAAGTDVVWVEDTTPAGAIAGGTEETWNWVTTNPTPFSGSVSHQSGIVPGLHQHFFYDSPTASQLQINAGETLFTYVYLDPANPPSEVMLQWNDGNWEHRAYWGANSIDWGVDGTNSRRYMGALPALGQWVRLEVPASQVGLEGQTLNGMAFTLFNGRASWDRAGKTSGGASNVIPAVSITAPVNGATYTAPATITLNATATDSDGTITKVEFYNDTTLLNTDTVAPYSFNWTNVGAGSYTLTAKATDNANATTTSTAISVTVTGAASADTIWVEDATPAGAIAGGTEETWNWITTNPTPFSGSVSHQSGIVPGLHQHYFYDSPTASQLQINAGETLFTYVYLDPANPPSEVMLQWNDGTWEHRAYWGANSIDWGVDGTNSRRYMGALPPLGQWVRLEVPASQVGLEGRPLNGMAFTLFNGRATWDRAGKK